MTQFKLSSLGGGINGVAPKLIGQGNNSSGMDGANTRAIERNVLRKAFGNNTMHFNNPGVPVSANSLIGRLCINNVCQNNGMPATPFRMATNSGDPNGTVNKAVSNLAPHKPSNQVYSRVHGWKENAGSVKVLRGDLITSHTNQQRDGSLYSGNIKFVYDGSDYVRFKKLQALNRNYNDKSFGGDRHSGSQSAIRRTRM